MLSLDLNLRATLPKDRGIEFKDTLLEYNLTQSNRFIEIISVEILI